MQRYTPGLNPSERQLGIVAKLVRSIVVGPIARLEMLPLDATAAGNSEIIEAHIPSQTFAALALTKGETLVLPPPARLGCLCLRPWGRSGLSGLSGARLPATQTH